MAENSAIEWTDATFNPWIGCTKVSAACDHCYAETLSKARLGVPWGAGQPRRRTTAENWKQPLRWNRKAEKEGRRMRVFCASLADVFDAEVPNEWRDELFALIAATPHLDWLLLTKRPKVALDYADAAARCGEHWLAGVGGPAVRWPLPNVWMGSTVENRPMWRARVPFLKEIAATKTFLSVEPLLEDLGDIDLQGIDWVIAGGESGPNARPSHPDWYRSIRDQCASAGVPFLFKQWGEWLPGQNEVYPNWDGRMVAHHQDNTWGLQNVKNYERNYVTWEPNGTLHHGDMIGKHHDVAAWARRVGKKAAGRLLDGVEHNGFPEARHAAAE